MPTSEVERSALIHREILQLAVLILVAAGAFLLTRAVAASNRDVNVRDAAEWYVLGQQHLDAGGLDAAIDAFRRATVRDRTEKRYVLALARALALNHDDEAARGALLTLRESAPEDARINLELARLAARRQDVTEALRFYHNALYAPWPADQGDARRGVRFELVRFLLTHDQSGRALSELLALSTDLPDDASAHLEAARLFVQASEYRHALEHFQRAIRLAPDNGDALAGAGTTALQMGDYAMARGYLNRAPPGRDDVATARELVDLVLSNDPLAARIGSGARRRRLQAALIYEDDRLAMCSGQDPAGRPAPLDEELQREVKAFQLQLKRPGSLEQDTVETGVDLIDRIAGRLADACGPPTALDRALVLIARRHGGGPR